MKTHLRTVLILLVVLTIPVGLAAAADPVSREGGSRATITAEPQRFPAEQEALLQALHLAKKKGDRERILDLEGRLAALRGTALATAPGAPATGVRVEVAEGAEALPRWQGNDILVAGTGETEIKPAMAADSYGDLYVALVRAGGTTTEQRKVVIYKSVDGGEHWGTWLSIVAIDPLDVPAVSLAVGRGTEEWVLMAYQRGNNEILVLRADPADASNNDVQVILSNPHVANPRIVTDCDEYAGWYAYVVFNAEGPDNWVLGCMRTMDYGVTWQPQVDVTWYCSTLGSYPYDGSLGRPDLDTGGALLYVVWDDKRSCAAADRDIKVSVSGDYGGSFDTPVVLGASSRDAYDPVVAAVNNMAADKTAVVAYTDDYGTDTDVNLVYTQDGGATWNTDTCVSCYTDADEAAADLIVSSNLGMIHAAYFYTRGEGRYIYHADTDHLSPTGLAGSGVPASDHGYASPDWPWPSLVVNPTLPVETQVGMAWTDTRDDWGNVYYDGPATVGLGTVVVDVTPDGVGASWALHTPTGDVVYGEEDAVLSDVMDGDYTIEWLTANGWTASCFGETLNLVEGSSISFSCVFDHEAPLILSVTDVPNDQGRQVRLVWERSVYDDPMVVPDVTGYSVFRKQDPLREPAAVDDGTAARLAGWDWLEWLPVSGDDVYQCVAPTLCDSTDEGNCWSTFMVRVTGANPYVFFDSPPAAGYSVDNLAPAVPENLRLAGEGLLAWDECPDADFDYFTLYGSPTEAMDPGAEVIGHTIGTGMDVTGQAHPWFLLTATDFAGNESGPAALASLTDVPGAGPARLALHAAVPNPFNPKTTIRFVIPEAAPVRLNVYDLSGRLVKALIDGRTLPRGGHEAVWDGRDGGDRAVAAGVYLCRIETGGRSLTRSMTLVR